MTTGAMELEDELDAFGDLISHAYRLSGEAPSRQAIDWANRQIQLPSDVQSDEARQRFIDGLKKRMQDALLQLTGASTLGSFIQNARERAGLDEMEGARRAGLRLPAYRQLEANRMPVWRAPAGAFGAFCRYLGIDASILLRWTSLELSSSPSLGRLDFVGDPRGDGLARLAGETDAGIAKEFDVWRRTFIDAYGPA